MYEHVLLHIHQKHNKYINKHTMRFLNLCFKNNNYNDNIDLWIKILNTHKIKKREDVYGCMGVIWLTPILCWSTI